MVCCGLRGESYVQAVRDWRRQFAPRVRPAVQAVQGKVVRCVTTRARVGLVMDLLTVELARGKLVIWLVGRTLVSERLWLERRLAWAQLVRAHWVTRWLVMELDCCWWVTRDLRKIRLQLGRTGH